MHRDSDSETIECQEARGKLFPDLAAPTCFNAGQFGCHVDMAKLCHAPIPNRLSTALGNKNIFRTHLHEVVENGTLASLTPQPP